MEQPTLNLLLADDDVDDCDFFKEVLEEIELSVDFNLVGNGVELMSYLYSTATPKPDLIFLDLNMPKKSGMDCMEEIKETKSLNTIPIVVFSTSMDPMIVDALYDLGAHYYIQKPGEFKSLKTVIKKAVLFFSSGHQSSRSREAFIIHP